MASGACGEGRKEGRKEYDGGALPLLFTPLPSYNRPGVWKPPRTRPLSTLPRRAPQPCLPVAYPARPSHTSEQPRDRANDRQSPRVLPSPRGTLEASVRGMHFFGARRVLYLKRGTRSLRIFVGAKIAGSLATAGALARSCSGADSGRRVTVDVSGTRLPAGGARQSEEWFHRQTSKQFTGMSLRHLRHREQ